MGKNAIVFIGMTYPHGIIRHFAYLAVELNKVLADKEDVDFYFASTDGETNQNAWPMIRDNFVSERIICEHKFEKLADRICILGKEYEKVLVHTGGGFGQTKQLVLARRRMNKLVSERLRIILAGTTHSFRNDSIHRIWMSALQCALYLLFYKKIIFQCQDAADAFVGSSLLFKAGKGVIVPLGCEGFVEPSPDVPTAIREKGLGDMLADKSLFKMVYLAQFRPGKMHAWLVKALIPIFKQHVEARLILCGMGNEVVVNDVKEIIKENGLESQVVIPGQIPRYEVPWLLKHVNCALVPSRAETFGHNFLEPMFAGLPVVGTRVGIGKEIIEDGKTGYGFSLRHPEEIGEAIAKMIRDPELARQMGGHAYARVSTTYRHSDVAKRLAEVYRGMLEG